MSKLKYVKLFEDYHEEMMREEGDGLEKDGFKYSSDTSDVTEKTSEELTDVIFLLNDGEGGDDLFAFFPNEYHNRDESDLRTCYSHTGQHSSCAVEYANESKLATVEEYSNLLKELEDSGYDFNIISQHPTEYLS